MKIDEDILDACVVFTPLLLLRKRLCEITLRICLSRLCFAVGIVSLPILAFKAQLGTCVCLLESFTIPSKVHNPVRYPSPAAALAIKSSPTPTTTNPMARATRSPFGASRSAVIAAVTRAIARRSMTPVTRRIAVKPAQP